MRSFSFAFILLLLCVALADAGTLQGKVSSPTNNGVVFVERIRGGPAPRETVPFVVTQNGQSFQPRVLVIPQGATVVFKNNDTVAHNVNWPSISGNKRLAHNVGTWASGDDRKFKFDTPGVVPLLCNMHPAMTGYIIVVPTEYYTYTTPTGEYTIRDVPDGHYNVSAWREGKMVETRQVTVVGKTTLNF